MRAGVLSPSSTPVRFGFFPRRSPGSWFLPVSRESEAAMSAGKKNAKNNNGGDGADGPPAVRGHPAAGARVDLGLLAYLLLPGRGGGPGGVAGQRPRRQAPARAGQKRPAGLRVALQAERAGDAYAFVRAA